jgi:hypothetical protein
LSAEFLGEALDAAFRVNQFLTAGEERMAARADFQVEFRLRRPRFPGRAAGAACVNVVVFRVDALLHSCLLMVPGKP